MEEQRATAESVRDSTAAERFAAQLRTLRTAVGNPSFRKMAGRSGRISHTTLHEAAAGTRFPSWETTREFVRACEADEAQWRRRWEDARRSGTTRAGPGGALTPVNTETATPHTATAPAVGQPAGSDGSDVVASSDPRPEDQCTRRAAEHPQAVARNKVTSLRQYRVPALAAATAAIVVVMVVVLGTTLLGGSSPNSSGAAAAPGPQSPSQSPSQPLAAGFSDPLIAGDSSEFVADVTIPDGTRVKVNAHFVKVWALANVGTVHWHNRFLVRTNPTGDDAGCQVPDRVAIGDTPPGKQVMISVPVTAPSRPGECWVSWKMVDEHGRAYFPSRRPVYFMVTVVA